MSNCRHMPLQRDRLTVHSFKIWCPFEHIAFCTYKNFGKSPWRTIAWSPKLRTFRSVKGPLSLLGTKGDLAFRANIRKLCFLQVPHLLISLKACAFVPYMARDGGLYWTKARLLRLDFPSVREQGLHRLQKWSRRSISDLVHTRVKPYFAIC